MRNASVTPPSRSEKSMSRSYNGERLETRDKRLEGDPVLLRKTPAGGIPRKPGAGYAVLKALMEATAQRGIPAPDEKLKQIVGAQIKSLLKGGYDAERIRHFAVELALAWDNAKGHQRLLGLRQSVLQDAADREHAAHEQRRREQAEPITDPEVARAFLVAAKRMFEGREVVSRG